MRGFARALMCLACIGDGRRLQQADEKHQSPKAGLGPAQTIRGIASLLLAGNHEDAFIPSAGRGRASPRTSFKHARVEMKKKKSKDKQSNPNADKKEKSSGKRPTGSVSWFDAEKGYGFIEHKGDKVYVNQTGLNMAAVNMGEGEKVAFDIVHDRWLFGLPRAVNVTLPKGSKAPKGGGFR